MLDRARLVRMGFSGFLTIKHLRETHLADVPTGPGVYVVVRDELTQPNFVSSGTGGRFKGRDPNVPVGTLEKKWVDDAYVIYIGKADAGSRGTRGLRKRMAEYLKFGGHSPIGHWGGRYLWQLGDTASLLAAWRRTDQPRADEQELLAAFVAEYGRLPFANLSN